MLAPATPAKEDAVQTAINAKSSFDLFMQASFLGTCLTLQCGRPAPDRRRSVLPVSNVREPQLYHAGVSP